MTRPSRRPVTTLPSRGVLTCLLVLAAIGLTGCESDRVPLGSPEADEQTVRTCRALLDDVPDVLADELRRPVEPDDALGAAWGEPPFVLLCGGTKPSDQDMFATCNVVDGMGWWSPTEQLTDDRVDAVLTTVGTEPLVQVTVPSSYRPQALAPVMAELAPALKRHLEIVQPCR